MTGKALASFASASTLSLKDVEGVYLKRDSSPPPPPRPPRDIIGRGAFKWAEGDPDDSNAVVLRRHSVNNIEEETAREAQAIQDLSDVLASPKHRDLDCRRRFVHLEGMSPDGLRMKISPRGLPILWSDPVSGLVRLAQPPNANSRLRDKRACVDSWHSVGGDLVLRTEALQSLLVDIALALLCLHAHERAHGDLKPQQILLDCIASGEKASLVTFLTDLDTLMPIDDRGLALPTLCHRPRTMTPDYASDDRLLWRRLSKTMPNQSYNAVIDDLHALRLTFLDLILALIYETKHIRISAVTKILEGALRSLREMLNHTREVSEHIIRAWTKWCDTFLADAAREEVVMRLLETAKTRHYDAGPDLSFLIGEGVKRPSENTRGRSESPNSRDRKKAKRESER